MLVLVKSRAGRGGISAQPGLPGLSSLPALGGGASIEEELHAQMDLGQQLVNSGMFDWALEDLPEHGIKRVEDRHAPRLAMLLFNQLRYGTRSADAGFFGIESAITEDIQTTDLALPTKWSLPIIRRIYPPIFDSPLFATQTMPGPLAYAFFMDFKREQDNTDFRAVNPFTAFLAANTIATATTFTLQMSQNAGVIGYGPYQIVAGQSVTIGLGTGGAETKVITSVVVAGNTATVTVPALANPHTAGDVVYVAAAALSAEAAIPQKAKLSLTRSSVTAQKWIMAATWTTEAMEDARAQLNLDVEGEMVQALSVEIGRELFGTIIGEIVQGATGGSTTLPALGATSVQDYRFKAIQPLYNAEAKIFARRFHDTDTILAGVDLAANIAQQDQFHVTPADSNNTLAQLGVTHLGTFQGKFQLYKTIFLPPNLGLIFQTPRDWLHAGYVYMPYIPLSPMPLVYAGYVVGSGNYQNTDEWTRNLRTRAGKLLTVADEYGLVVQG